MISKFGSNGRSPSPSSPARWVYWARQHRACGLFCQSLQMSVLRNSIRIILTCFLKQRRLLHDILAFGPSYKPTIGYGPAGRAADSMYSLRKDWMTLSLRSRPCRDRLWSYWIPREVPSPQARYVTFHQQVITSNPRNSKGGDHCCYPLSRRRLEETFESHGRPRTGRELSMTFMYFPLRQH